MPRDSRSAVSVEQPMNFGFVTALRHPQRQQRPRDFEPSKFTNSVKLFVNIQKKINKCVLFIQTQLIIKKKKKSPESRSKPL